MVFKKGETTNPKGNNGHVKGYQRYADRVVYLQSQYTTEQIKELATNEKAFGKLPIRDGQIIMQLASTIMGDDRRLEREALLDRIEGKPAQYIETKNETTVEHSVKERKEKAKEEAKGMMVKLIDSKIKTKPESSAMH